MSGAHSADQSAWSRIARYLPWTDGTGRPWPGVRRLPMAAPFTFLYLIGSWFLFIRFARRRGGGYAIDQEALRPFLYAIPDLTERPARVLRAFVTAPFLNHNDVQLVYVTLLLLLFGVMFEAKEGTRRTVLIFFGTTWLGALVAGALVHLLYPGLVDQTVLQKAWARTWSGGSAGCYGIMGALAGRARRPWALLFLMVLWEVNVVLWYLKHLTPAFHMTALAAGFAVTRYLLVPRGGVGGRSQRLRLGQQRWQRRTVLLQLRRADALHPRELVAGCGLMCRQ